MENSKVTITVEIEQAGQKCSANIDLTYANHLEKFHGIDLIGQIDQLVSVLEAELKIYLNKIK
jgi:hypothetical protein